LCGRKYGGKHFVLSFSPRVTASAANVSPFVCTLFPPFMWSEYVAKLRPPCAGFHVSQVRRGVRGENPPSFWGFLSPENPLAFWSLYPCWGRSSNRRVAVGVRVGGGELGGIEEGRSGGGWSGGSNRKGLIDRWPARVKMLALFKMGEHLRFVGGGRQSRTRPAFAVDEGVRRRMNERTGPPLPPPPQNGEHFPCTRRTGRWGLSQSRGGRKPRPGCPHTGTPSPSPGPGLQNSGGIPLVLVRQMQKLEALFLRGGGNTQSPGGVFLEGEIVGHWEGKPPPPLTCVPLFTP